MSLRHSMEDRIAAEAWKNPQFKKELLENPRAALLKHFQMNIPGNPGNGMFARHIRLVAHITVAVKIARKNKQEG